MEKFNQYDNALDYILNNNNCDHDAEYRQDIIDILKDEDLRGERFTGVQRISLAQFLCDRELGIRGTSERIVRQGVDIETESPYDWPYHVRWEVYRWMLDECKREVDKEFEWHYKYGVLRYYNEKNYDCNDWAMKIIQKIEYNEVLYIAIHTGIGKCIELIIMNYHDYNIIDAVWYCELCDRVTCKCFEI